MQIPLKGESLENGFLATDVLEPEATTLKEPTQVGQEKVTLFQHHIVQTMIAGGDGNTHLEGCIWSIITVDDSCFRILTDSIVNTLVLQCTHISSNTFGLVDKCLTVVEVHILCAVCDIRITGESTIETTLHLRFACAFDESSFHDKAVTTEELGIVPQSLGNVHFYIVGVEQSDRVSKHEYRHIPNLLTVTSGDGSVNTQELPNLVGAIVIRFALELVENDALYIAEQVAILLDLICTVQRNSITARLVVQKQLMEDTVCLPLGSHSGAGEEQLTDVAVELLRYIIKFVVEPVKQCKFFTLISEAVYTQSSEIGGLATGSIGFTNVDLWFSSCGVHQ